MLVELSSFIESDLEGLVEGADPGEMKINYRDTPFSVTNLRPVILTNKSQAALKPG